MQQAMMVAHYEEMIMRAKLDNHSEGSIKALENQLNIWKTALEAKQS
jgi:hypothetical protein